MAKASLVLPDGTKVNIEGNAEEVAVLLAKCSSTAPAAASRSAGKKGVKKRRSGAGNPSTRTKSKGPVGLITELAEEGFFKTKRALPEIQKKLEENGHIYAQSSLSPAALGMTKKKILRRLKEKKGWVYVRGPARI